MPIGVTLNSATGVLSGTPAAGSAGDYLLSVTAQNGIGAGVSQDFTLTVNQPPAITSLPSTRFLVGSPGSFTVVATGLPAPSFSTSSALPTGVTLDGSTGILSGTPGAGTGQAFNVAFTAANGVGTPSTQHFTLFVDQVAAITSAASTSTLESDPEPATWLVSRPANFASLATDSDLRVSWSNGFNGAGVTSARTVTIDWIDIQ